MWSAGGCALENHSSVCIAALGDWTCALHKALAKPSSRPVISRDEFGKAIDVLAGVDKAGDVEGGTADLKVIAACSLDRQR